MKYFILTCINENSEIVDQQLFANEQRAVEEMKAQYERERNDILDTWSESELTEDFCSEVGAEITFGCDPLTYRWKILECQLQN